MLENIHRVCFVVPALDEAAECTELEKNKHKFGISKLDAPHIFRESAEEVVGPMLQILRQPSVTSRAEWRPAQLVLLLLAVKVITKIRMNSSKLL